MMKQKRISFLLSQEGIDSLERVCYLEPWIQDNLQTVKKEEGRFRIEFEEADLAECLGAVAYQANWTGEEDRMETLQHKLKTYLMLSRVDVRHYQKNYQGGMD